MTNASRILECLLRQAEKPTSPMDLSMLLALPLPSVMQGLAALHQQGLLALKPSRPGNTLAPTNIRLTLAGLAVASAVAKKRALRIDVRTAA